MTVVNFEPRAEFPDSEPQPAVRFPAAILAAAEFAGSHAATIIASDEVLIRTDPGYFVVSNAALLALYSTMHPPEADGSADPQH
jgi:hypothetical protein